MRGGRRREREVSLLLIRPPILSDKGLTLMSSLNLNYVLKALSPSPATLGVRASPLNFGETQFSP